jgi:hypothetical protein
MMFKLGFFGSFLLPFTMFTFIHSYSPLVINTYAFGIGFAICIPWVLMCSYLPKMFPIYLLGTGSGFSWSVGRIVTAFVSLASGPIILAFGGSYAAPAAIVSLTYLIGFFAAFAAKEPKEWVEPYRPALAPLSVGELDLIGII